VRFYTLEKLHKLLEAVERARVRGRQPLADLEFRVAKIDNKDFPDPRHWEPFAPGSAWGGRDVTTWFRATVRIPDAWRQHRLYLHFRLGQGGDWVSAPEAMLYVDGKPLQGIDVNHRRVWLPPALCQQEQLAVSLRAWSGMFRAPAPHYFDVAELLWVDEPCERFYHLARVLLEAVMELGEGDLRRIRLLDAVDDAFRRLDFTRPGSDVFCASAAPALAFLEQQLVGWHEQDETKPRVWAVGHAHIDLAWLWQLRHTREKAARTFATVLHLMRQYPEYRFVHSSPQLYAYLEQDEPDLFAQIGERIAEGRWAITGGMWIEADTNLPSGESLVRQFLHGQRYSRGRFGSASRLLWLPDVFGYSWALPQIARGSGIDFFLTSKISWSQFNRFPYDTFRWRGIDGTELLTHFVTTPEPDIPFYTYNGKLTPAEVTGAWESYRQKEVNDELLLLFGYGDGGGGPTAEMLEAGRALKNLPGLPSVAQTLPEDYFDGLAARVDGERLPVWDGELYLEYHRGTYTSQAYNKWANRHAEGLYHHAEWLGALASLLVKSAYPAEALRAGWERILLNQFHDILPGSSIAEVYTDSHADYAAIFAAGTAAVDQAQDGLLGALALKQPGVVFFNGCSWARDGLVSLPWSEALAGGLLVDPEGRAVETQRTGGEAGDQLILYVRDVPPLGYAAIQLAATAGPLAREATVTVTKTRLETNFYRLELDDRGQIASLYDKRYGREVLAAPGNVFQTFVDRPMAFDAWDIDIYYQERQEPVTNLVEATVEEEGPLRGVLRLQWRFGDSTITQWLTLYAYSPRIDFRTEVDWQERQILLKVAFPVRIRATRATYDIQFGTIQRPVHWNTSWDYARFEVPAHRWADLSEGDYGVALLNDCKYGYDIHDNMMRLTLLKSAISPDPEADRGHHQFTYSLLPHGGDWRSGGVVAEGYALNWPLLAVPAAANPAGEVPDRFSLASVLADHVILETVKQAEDGDGWIVRFYECQQRRNPEVLAQFGVPLLRAARCNLIEDVEEDVPVAGDLLTFAIKPYEIRSFRLWFAGDGQAADHDAGER
jgi:alpha-mannosidase